MIQESPFYPIDYKPLWSCDVRRPLQYFETNFPSAPKLPTLGIIDEDDYFDEIINAMSDNEEEGADEGDDD